MALALKELYLQKEWKDYKSEIEEMRKAVCYTSEDEAIAFAQTFCYTVIRYLWNIVDYKSRWKCRQTEFVKVELNVSSVHLAKEISNYFATLNIMEYAYLLGNLYTMLLPDKFRSDNGIYYTPPALAERLLDILAAEGADWAQADVLDPACGGGAFLVTVANRMLGDYRIRELPPEMKLTHIEKHLAGIELDKFAAFITQCLLDIILYGESVRAGRRLRPIIAVQDTIQYAMGETRKFDVIVGNPPYGKTKLDEDTRKAYARSLYGHANLYGLFIDAATRLKKESGLIGFVLPTSFLGGKYFSNLRSFLFEEAPPLAIDFVAMRTGVFEQVLQETCLVVFGKNTLRDITVNKIDIESQMSIVTRVGTFKIEEGTAPWIIARELSEAEIISKITGMTCSIKDYGYKVSTGQLVWNRFKEQISECEMPGMKPIIWAEAITSEGNFEFRYQYRKKLKYINILEKQDFLICNEPVVLVQRTTAKEQQRRLQSCVLPREFVEQWNGVVVENHVNMVHPIKEKPQLSLEALSLFLNSQIVDRIFRCMSGSVAVSATELHALPMPPIEALKGLEEQALLVQRSKLDKEIQERVEKIIMNAYGLEEVNDV